jgi:Zn-dependent M16 (insulinase) family peptidase
MIKCYGASTGFNEIDKVRYGEDTLHTYEHKASGISVIWIENDDIRKSFTLGVKTPTTDSTGVNHIIEHTLFTGSKKYPSPSLFFDANSSYPNLFMNALTSGDMTIFPFSTPYMECYTNLLDIYLDSIFNPNLLHESAGFYEESFNYNPDSRAFGGVVYNEMKGAYGSIDRVIYRSIREAVYKKTHYANDSGGDPNEIPKLTYNDFKETYKKYYYPANMKIVLYGALPIDEVLAAIESYLKNDYHPKGEVNLMVELPKAPSYQRYKAMPEGQKPCLIKSFVIPNKLSAKELASLNLWINAYLLSPNSPFQKQVERAGFTNVKVFKDDDLPYPIYSIIVQDIPLSKFKAYSAVLDHILSKLAEESGKDKKIEEDTVREARLAVLYEDDNVNRGIDIAQSILDGWAHERELYQYFINRDDLQKKEELSSHYAEILFKQSYAYTIELTPAKQTIMNPLHLSQIQADKWRDIIENMSNWQNQRASLKPISLEQLVIKPSFNIKIKAKKDQAYVRTRVSKKLARSQLYYNTSHIKEEKLPYMFLYAYLLGESAKELTPFKGILEAKCIAFNNEKNYSPFLKVTVLTEENEKNHGGLLTKARESLLAKSDSWYQHKLLKFASDFREGWSTNVLSALSSLDMGHENGAKRYLFEQGYPLYMFCESVNKGNQSRLIASIKEIDKCLYNQNGLVVATAAPKLFANPYETSWKKIIKNQPSLEVIEPEYHFSVLPQKSALLNDTQVDYIYLQYTKPSTKLDGIDYLTAVYLTKHYLNPQIRSQLGAYGAGCQLSSSDTISLFTYRDPDHQVSMGIFKAIPDYLEKHVESDLLEDAKMEALSRIHHQFRLLSNEMDKADSAERNILMGIQSEYIENLQNEVIKADTGDVKQKADLFKVILKEGALGIATHHQKELIGDYKVYHFK